MGKVITLKAWARDHKEQFDADTLLEMVECQKGAACSLLYEVPVDDEHIIIAAVTEDDSVTTHDLTLLIGEIREDTDLLYYIAEHGWNVESEIGVGRDSDIAVLKSLTEAWLESVDYHVPDDAQLVWSKDRERWVVA